MKIRYGFVSNSSSASYIVKINDIDLETFCDEIYREFLYSHLDKEDIREQMRNDILYCEGEIAKEKDIRLFNDDYYQRQIEKSRAILELLNKDLGDDIESLLLLLKEYYRIKIEEKDDGVEIFSFVSMHNSYSDVPAFVKDIVMYYMFEKDNIVECIVEHD